MNLYAPVLLYFGVHEKSWFVTIIREKGESHNFMNEYWIY